MRWLLKRWWFWAGTGFMLVAVVAGYLLIPVGEAPPIGISRAGCDKIRFGMSLEELAELLGDWQYAELVGIGESQSDILTWVDEDDNRIVVKLNIMTVRNGALARRDFGVTRKQFVRSELSFVELMKRRIERRIRALWP
ncbi:MAG TPA: hypothetical protein VGY66_18030 [Gemmataceae bacterium]|jgi:hypothetical protein|nr:hypothetical protein [Gemmataceae bacterium]